MEMMREMGFCNGIENYSRPLSGRAPGSRPACLLDYFPKDFLLIVDESHVSIPQVGGMYEGDRSRKQTLVDYGFRLPCALDNRPLKFPEFEAMVPQTIYVSATPGPYELKKSKGVVVEQIIRPTGLVDPEVEIRPTEGQIDDLVREVEKVAKAKERVLVTTLTKRMSEDLTDFLLTKGLRVRYLHSEIESLKRIEILKDLRKGNFDALDRHQFIAGRSRSAGSGIGSRAGCGQRRLPAQRNESHPSVRSSRQKREWTGHFVCRSGDRFDEKSLGRDG